VNNDKIPRGFFLIYRKNPTQDLSLRRNNAL